MLNKRENHFVHVIKELLEYKDQLLILALVLIIVGGGYFSYSYYKEGIETNAHATFIECLQYVDARVGDADKKGALEEVESFDTEEQKWIRVEESFRDGYEKHKSSGLAPIFLSYRSEALFNLGKAEEAIKILKQSIKDCSSQELKQLYLVKLALMQMDSDEAEEKEIGIKLLTALTDQVKFAELINKIDSKTSLVWGINYVHDLALYRLGEYYWFKKNFDLVKNYWNQLLLKYGKNTKTPSSWAALAYDKLKLIESK